VGKKAAFYAEDGLLLGGGIII
jgi:hypothetical protein